MIRFLIFIIAILTAAPYAAAQSTLPGRSALGNEAMVQTWLVADHVTVTPGTTFHVGLRMEIEPGWHTYWRNPGDSGEPTLIVWDLPEGVTAGEIIWPAPSAFPYGHLMNYGYGNEVVLPVPLTIAEDFDGRFLEIRAATSWLVCEEVCIPESADLDLFLTVSAEAAADSAGAALIESGLDRVPQPSGIAAGISRSSQSLLLTVATP